MGLEGVQEKKFLPIIITLFLKQTNSNKISAPLQFFWNHGDANSSKENSISCELDVLVLNCQK